MHRRRALRGLLAATTVGLAGCGGDGSGDEDGDPESDGGTDATPDGTAASSGDLDVTSAAFADGERIPERYTADGDDVSPPLRIDGVPDDAVAFAVVVGDPDAPDPPFTHWLLWNVPADTSEIPEDRPREETLPDLGDARQGTNDFGEVGYRGPSPPADDDPHRYRFELHALADSLDVSPGTERATMLDAVDDVRIETAEFAGVYGR